MRIFVFEMIFSVFILGMVRFCIRCALKISQSGAEILFICVYALKDIMFDLYYYSFAYKTDFYGHF